MTDWAIYLASLIGSWQALAVPHHDAHVVQGEGFAAAVFDSQPVFDNAILLDARALAEIQDSYPPGRRPAVWTAEPTTAVEMEAAGYVRDTTTVAMVLHLEHLVEGRSVKPDVRVERVDVDVVTALNDLTPDLLLGVPGVRAYASADRSAGVVLIELGADTNVSFVATRPEVRRRGMATTILHQALAEAVSDGFTTSCLQSTPMAEGVYSRLGYRPVARWQEWLPAHG